MASLVTMLFRNDEVHCRTENKGRPYTQELFVIRDEYVMQSQEKIGFSLFFEVLTEYSLAYSWILSFLVQHGFQILLGQYLYHSSSLLFM